LSDKLAADENARRIYLKDGKAPAVGEIFRNPQVARAYKLIAEHGPTVVYRGDIGAAIFKTSKRFAGFLSAEDFSEFSSEWVEPLSTTYRDSTVYQLPPNGQGAGTLEMLNIMENFPLHGADPLSADAYHFKIEAQKLAFQDQRRYLADPRHNDVPLERLLSKEYAKERAALIDSGRAQGDSRPGKLAAAGHTIYLAAADREGNVVSWIQSISDLFGSGIVVDDFGFHLHNRGAAFSFDPARDESGAGPGAVRLQRRGSRHEHSGRARSAEVHQNDLGRLRRPDRRPGAGRDLRGARKARACARGVGRLFGVSGRRTGGHAGCSGRGQLRGIVATQRRRGDSRARPVFLKQT
jgi:gamma-glutamyltranspeptidase